MPVEHPTSPRGRQETPERNMKPGPGKTARVTTKSDGKSSFNRKGGFRGKTEATRTRGPGRHQMTRTSDGKSSFKRS